MAISHALFFINFRKYQQDILDVFEQRFKAGDRKYHFVAPPGSGKTLIGLEIIRQLGKDAVVFSPNQAIQGQWVKRLKEITEDVSISTDYHSDADILSLTYQIISTKEMHTNKMHRHAKEILELLKTRKTVVLDECHHLTAYWAGIIKKLIKKDVYLIGLTATPPLDKTNQEVETYINLLDEVDYEILLPPVIKEGYLAPFQDLIYIVEPTEEEVEIINNLCRKYNTIMKKLLSVTDIFPIHFWAEKRLEDFRDSHDNPVPFDMLYLSRPEFCIALARFVQSKLIELPYSVIITEEMEQPLTFDDVLMVIEDYTINYLVKTEGATLYFDELKSALKEMGYLLSPSGIKSLPTGIRSILGFSRSKMISMKRIIAHEMRLMKKYFVDIGVSIYQVPGLSTQEAERGKSF
ncbi:MAG: DEAD/DEAH box helicase family protein [Candidatus Pacearchaeota archaeon]|nr:DEAD/DEAH box helicase family protein [Candidatus Pacearchaeota archaeon]